MARRKSCRGKPMIDIYTVLLNRWLEPKNSPVPEETQRQVLNEIASRIFEYVEEALNQKDIWAGISIIARGERVLGKYTAENFDQLLPFQRQLQGTLHTVWRMTRRRFIRAALRCPDHEYPKYLATFTEGWLDGPDALADFHAAERHVDEGLSLFSDLRKNG